MSTILIFTFTLLVCVFICHNLAKARGRDPVFWGIMGALFGPLAIPFILIAGKKRRPTSRP